MSVDRWQIYCNTESKWVDGWTTSKPNVCFNNNQHSVNPESQNIIESTQIISVKIIQETVPTGGRYCCEGFDFDCPANETTEYVVEWPIPVTTSVVTIQCFPENIGDVINTIVNPKTIVGSTTSETLQGSYTCSVNSTAIQTAELGMECYIGTEFLGRILNINKETLQITFEQSTTTTHSMGSYFKIQIKIIRNHTLSNFFQLGVSNIGGKYLPVGYKTHVFYTNATNVDKKFRFSIEYLF